MVCVRKRPGIAGILAPPVYEYSSEVENQSNPRNTGAHVVTTTDFCVDTPKVKVSVRYELMQEDFDKLAFVKEILLSQLSPTLEAHGLKFKYNRGGGPGEVPAKPDGIFFWTVEVINRIEKQKKDDPEFFWLLIQTDVGKAINLKTQKQLRYGNAFVSFVIRFRSVSHDYLDIPAKGIGSAFYLDELLSRLEAELPRPDEYADWKKRLQWHCEMIRKHHQTIFSAISRSTIEAIFNQIRHRAIGRNI